MLPMLRIPSDRVTAIWIVFVTIFCITFALLAVDDLVHGDAVVASCLWLAILAWIVYACSRYAGGLRAWVIELAGEVTGRRFVEADPSEGEVRFGAVLCGRRIGRRIALNRIDSVQWHTGQASYMVGRDMNDWTVCLWYRHGASAESPAKRKRRTPDLNGYFFCPPRKREVTEALALAFVAMLREAGVPLMQGEDETRFVRGDLPRLA